MKVEEKIKLVKETLDALHDLQEFGFEPFIVQSSFDGMNWSNVGKMECTFTNCYYRTIRSGLKCDDIVPGTVFRLPCQTEGYLTPTTVGPNSVVINHTTYFYSDLHRDRWQIKIPGEAWKRC